MNRRLAVSSWLLAMSLAPAAAAQVRDTAPLAAAATATGTIAGTVVEDSEPARPVRRAIVTLNSTDSSVGRTAITDDAGRFVFTSLPGARYSLVASKRGWVSGMYGAKAIGRPGHTLLLAAGARAAATIRIAHGGVISGTILDQFGQPVIGATLRVMKFAYTFNTGERRLTPVAAMTAGAVDERGTYRIYGMAPGEYYISVVNQSSPFSSGRDLHLTSDVDVEEAVKAAQAGPSAPVADVPQPNVGYSTIFYPSALSVAQATPITIRAGEERTGVDVTVQYSPVARVDGTVTSPAGEPTAARVYLVLNDSTGAPIGIQNLRSTEAGADGRFTFADVAAGAYRLSAHQQLPGSTRERPQVIAGTTDVDVQSERVSGLSLPLREAFSVSGTITYDGAGPPPNFSALRVMLSPVQGTTTSVTIGMGTPTTTADGRFSISAVTPGRYRLAVNGLPGTVVLRSATILGQDTLDAPVDVEQSIADAAIVVTDRVSELSGKVEAAGASADYTMILFPSNRAYWGGQSRRILNARTSSDGSFLFRNVPPGDYLLAPVDDVEPGEWYDPSFLQRLVSGAVPVTIGEGDKKVQDVRAGGG